jgi:type IV secretory pathway protease TraF
MPAARSGSALGRPMLVDDQHVAVRATRDGLADALSEQADRLGRLTYRWDELRVGVGLVVTDDDRSHDLSSRYIGGNELIIAS